jgi:hypothetical protein
MNGLCVGGWHDVLNPERLRMEIVKAFDTCISDNAMQGMRDRVNSSSLGTISRKALGAEESPIE